MSRMYKYWATVAWMVLSLTVVSCDEEETSSTKDLYELVVDKPVLRIGQNQEVAVNVVLGNEGYTVESYDTSIATASIDGERITVKSLSKNGATTVQVTDCEGVVAYISVNVGVFELEVSPSVVEMEVGNEMDLSVTMGNFSSNEELSVVVDDESIIRLTNTDKYRPYYLVEGLQIGQTSVVFTDRLNKQCTVEVNILPIGLELSDLMPSVGVNNKVQIEILKGNGGYRFVPEDATIVEAEPVDDTRFNLIGKKEGKTTVRVIDQMEQEATLTVTVNKVDQVADLGSNNYFSVSFENAGTADASLKSLSNITYEIRFMMDNKNGSGDARINTLLGIEKIFLLRVDVHKGASDTEKRYLQLAADDKGGIRFEGQTEIETGVWYNAAVVLDDSKSGNERISLYLNGQKEELQLSSGTPDDLRDVNLTENFFIGRSDNKRYLNGAISYARIWSKALSPSDIADQQNSFFTDMRDGLVANWLFNNGNGAVKTFVSLADKSFEAVGAYTVSTWRTDPLLQGE